MLLFQARLDLEIKDSVEGKNLSQEEGRMKISCPRCGGVMVYEKFYGNAEFFFGWRCILCGEIVDQVIQENRLIQAR
jgi:DNA-directed RNA polymerase subunit RPC12/RpoP